MIVSSGEKRVTLLNGRSSLGTVRLLRDESVE